jgi:hypothetical protein
VEADHLREDGLAGKYIQSSEPQRAVLAAFQISAFCLSSLCRGFQELTPILLVGFFQTPPIPMQEQII